MAATPSIMPSSMQMSMTLAPFSTCCRAQATNVDEPANISKTAGGAQQGGGGEGIAAMVVGRGAGLGYGGQVDDGVHTAQRFRESGAAFEVAMRQFDGGGQVRGRTSHQASQGTAL